MTLNSLRDLYLEQLLDLHDAEHQIIKALPKMIEAAQSGSLKAALHDHLNATKEHANRIQQIFQRIGEKPKAEKCKGMQGILKEGDDLVGEIKNHELRDAAIIASAQRVEHYEMAGYGTARAYAELLGEDEASNLLQQTLDEEKEADATLTSLAGDVNVEANAELAEEESEPRRSRTPRAA